MSQDIKLLRVKIFDELSKIVDPEINTSIVELELIDEVDITRIKKGQKIVVTLEAYKSQSFEAKVTHITPKMDGRTQTFEIEGVFVDFPSELYMGLTGEGNIIVKQIKQALVIPREYLIDLNKVETENGMKKVKIGVQSLSHVEIISGLKEGEEILKPL